MAASAVTYLHIYAKGGGGMRRRDFIHFPNASSRRAGLHNFAPSCNSSSSSNLTLVLVLYNIETVRL
jgi:hypothetical protein